MHFFFRAEDWPCFAHTLDHVGKHFIRVHFDGFWHLWVNIYAHGAKLEQDSGQTVIQHVLVNIVHKSSTPNSSAAALRTLVTENRHSKADMTQLELAVGIDGGSIFRNGTYFLEGASQFLFLLTKLSFFYVS